MSWRLLTQHGEETEDEALYEFSGDEDDRLRIFWGNERPSSSESEDSEPRNQPTFDDDQTQVIIFSIFAFCFESLQRQLKSQKNLFDEQINELKTENRENLREKRKYACNLLKINKKLKKTQQRLKETQKELKETQEKLNSRNEQFQAFMKTISVTVNVNYVIRDKIEWTDKQLSGLYQMVGIMNDRPVYRREEETRDGKEIRLLFNHRRYDPSIQNGRQSWGIESWNWKQPDTANYRYLGGKKLKLYIYSKEFDVKKLNGTWISANENDVEDSRQRHVRVQIN